MKPSLILVLLMVLAGCGGEPPVDPAHVARVDQWHAGRIDRLRSDTGWLTLVGLHELNQGVNTVGSARDVDVRLVDSAPPLAGAIEIGDLGIIFQAHPMAEVTLFGSESPEAVTKVLLESDAAGEPTILACGSLVFHVIDRQGRLFLRVKDRQSQVLADFTGIQRYPVETRWRVTARLDGPAGEQMIPDVLGQESAAPYPGDLVFDLEGDTHRIRPSGRPGESLFLVFADLTNGKETYPGGRFLVIDAPDSTGSYTVDFNQAYNPPCVFTPYATCPLPAPGNRLDVAITAGEMMWGGHH